MSSRTLSSMYLDHIIESERSKFPQRECSMASINIPFYNDSVPWLQDYNVDRHICLTKSFRLVPWCLYQPPIWLQLKGPSGTDHGPIKRRPLSLQPPAPTNLLPVCTRIRCCCFYAIRFPVL
ncbi:hypothetical protein CEXT_547741 [Caerostris extrusa]|uniref:Uncharacterized protein n=1 Tax=Caerostris extrusa TaxID=172846 RepID=A0AAV4S5G5_CAEEX|nr:hypothetical protein CEXT_547741 [Caerostris extrusa]